MLKVILIPILTRKENKREFLLQAAGSAKLTIIAQILDPASGVSAGELTAHMQEGEALLDEMKKALHAIGKRSKAYSEWGPLKDKIGIIAKREEVEEIVVQKRGKAAQKEIALLKELGLPVREIKEY